MRKLNTLWLRLAISFLIVTLLVITAVAWVVRTSVESSFGDYVNVSNMARFDGDLVSALENHYVEHNDWANVGTLLPARGGGQGIRVGEEPDEVQNPRGAQLFVANTDGMIVAATQPDWVEMAIADIGPSRQVDLAVDGKVIGTLGEQTPGTVALNAAERRFLQETTDGLLLTGLIAGLIAFVLSIGLSYSLTRPLQHLTDRITAWRLQEEKIPVRLQGTEEIRRLAVAFDDLLARLAAGEAQRQQMSADIAHELRTPVTVMRGHLEAMMDGVYPLDTAHLVVAYDQVLHLARLVEDLRLLTQAEAGRLPLNPSMVEINSVVEKSIERFGPLIHDHEINLATHLSAEPLTVLVDPHRIQQVLDNLLSNALRHTLPNGEIIIRTYQAERQVVVSIFNQSEQLLTDAQITQMFDRFWRGENDRNAGGSGLGLSITRELLRLQGGDIQAERESQGLTVTFVLPPFAGSEASGNP